MVLAEHNNRLPPVADKRRVLWRRGQRKFALQAIIFFGHRKSRECSPKIREFRASGIPVQERVDLLDREAAYEAMQYLNFEQYPPVLRLNIRHFRFTDIVKRCKAAAVFTCINAFCGICKA